MRVPNYFCRTRKSTSFQHAQNWTAPRQIGTHTPYQGSCCHALNQDAFSRSHYKLTLIRIRR